MRRMRRFVVVGALVAAVALVLGAFPGEFVRARDDAMWPALRAGEVAYVRPASTATKERPLARGALVAVRDDDGAASFGRIVGHAGETLRLAGGELLLGDAPLVVPFDEQAWIPWSDTAREATNWAWLGLDDWRREEGGWSGDAEAPALRLAPLDDGWLRDDGTREAGRASTASSRVALRVLWSRPQGQLVVELRDGGAVVQFVVERAGAKVSNAVKLLESRGEEVERGLGYADQEGLPEGAFEQEWLFEARAGWAQVRVDGEHYMSVPFPREGVAPAYAPRALVRFGAGGATLARLATWRAPAWRGEGAALRVAPSHALVLADAPAAAAAWSSCQRPLDRILGRPVAVVWPPSGWRFLP